MNTVTQQLSSMIKFSVLLLLIGGLLLFFLIELILKIGPLDAI